MTHRVHLLWNIMKLYMAWFSYKNKLLEYFRIFWGLHKSCKTVQRVLICFLLPQFLLLNHPVPLCYICHNYEAINHTLLLTRLHTLCIFSLLFFFSLRSFLSQDPIQDTAFPVSHHASSGSSALWQSLDFPCFS